MFYISSASWYYISELWSAIWYHTVLLATQIKCTPHLNCSHTSWYSLYLSWRDGRLDLGEWLHTLYQDGLPAHGRSCNQALTWQYKAGSQTRKLLITSKKN